MNGTTDLGASGMLGMSRQGLNALTAALYRDLGGNAAAYLQEAGFGSGAFDIFTRWVEQQGGSADRIPASQFGDWVNRFFADMGWGSVEFGPLGGGLAAIDSQDWAEATPDHPLEFPACYFTSGVLAELFGRLSDSQVAVMEVECRSMGAERCRFLVGSGDAIQRVYDGVAQGTSYDQLI